MAEQRYKAVLAVIGDGRTITEVAQSWGVSRQTLHDWLGRYEQAGLEGLVDRSHRPGSCPHLHEGPVSEDGLRPVEVFAHYRGAMRERFARVNDDVSRSFASREGTCPPSVPALEPSSSRTAVPPLLLV